MEMEQSVPKRRHIKFRSRRITQIKITTCTIRHHTNILENSAFICCTHVRLLLVQNGVKNHNIEYKVCGTTFFSFKITAEIISVHTKNMGESGKGKSIPLQARSAQRVPKVKVPRLRDSGSGWWQGCQPYAPTAFYP